MLGLSDRADGVPTQVSGILSDLETNLIDSPDFSRRMQGLLDELDRLQREQFSPIGDELTAAIKGTQSRWQSSPRPAGRDSEDRIASRAHAGEHQQQVIESLEHLLSQLRQWDDYRRFQRDVSQLLRDQEEVAPIDRRTGSADAGPRPQGAFAAGNGRLDGFALWTSSSSWARRQNRIEQEMEQTMAATAAAQRTGRRRHTLSDALAEARRRWESPRRWHRRGQQDSRQRPPGRAPVTDHQLILQNLQAVLDILANSPARRGR